MSKNTNYHFFKADSEQVIKEVGKARLLEHLRSMLLIRNFEVRAEAAYLQRENWGFFSLLYGTRGGAGSSCRCHWSR